MASIQTLKETIKNLEQRLDICQKNYHIKDKMHSNMSQRHYKVMQYLEERFPVAWANVLEVLASECSQDELGEVLPDELDERSLEKHKARTEAHNAFKGSE